MTAMPAHRALTAIPRATGTFVRPQRFTACFSVHAAADPSVMPRILQVFAKRGLLPSQCHGTVCGPREEELQVDLQLKDTDRDTAWRLAVDLRALIAVECVLTSEKL